MSYIATMYLNCHSYYSLRYGTLSPQDIVNQAVALGIDRVALTDINNTSGVFEFYRACKQAGITPVVGIEFLQENQIRYIGIAQNREGFRELTTLLSAHQMNGAGISIHTTSWENSVSLC